MDKTIVIGLTGHADRYRLDEDVYDRLTRYLDRAGVRLRDDPDREEVLADLERSIGDKLATALGSADRLVIAVDIDGVLDDVGAVDTGSDGGREPRIHEVARRPVGRRLQRIREGQKMAGVCTGLAAYAELDVAWVRTLFVLGTVLTAGILGLVYIALVFIMPVASRRAT